MAFVKSISIHKNVGDALKYITNPKKTKGGLLVDSINCSTDFKTATQQFNLYQKMYFDGKYQNTDKQKIIAHHFIQSFSKTDKLTPAEALQVGIDTMKDYLGDNADGYQILVATHTDKKHLHNHIIVNSINLKGERYHSNKKSLNELREVSNTITSQRGLSVIEKSNNKSKSLPYNIWANKKRGYGYKNQLQLAIDRAIINSNTTDEIVDSIIKQGYDAKIMSNKDGEYLSVKMPNFKYFSNSKNLDNDGVYTLNSILERMENKELAMSQLNQTLIYNTKKEKEIKNAKNINNQKSIGFKYSSIIKLIFRLIDKNDVGYPTKKYFKREPYSKQNDFYVQVLARQINYLNENNIQTEQQLIDKLDSTKSIYNENLLELNKLVSFKNKLITVVKAIDKIQELESVSTLTKSQLIELKTARKVTANYDVHKYKDYNLAIKNTTQKIQDLKTVVENAGGQVKVENEILKIYQGLKDDKDISEIIKIVDGSVEVTVDDTKNKEIEKTKQNEIKNKLSSKPHTR